MPSYIENDIPCKATDNIENDRLYQMGFTRGYNEGVMTAYKQYEERLLCQQIRYIVVTQEQFDTMTKDVNFKL
jgi:hypothetical protein